MSPVLLKNARIFDSDSKDCREGQHLLIEGGRIREMSSKPIKTSEAQIIEVGGRELIKEQLS
jgi:dihydroorotase-like cyclic amidohydrolase